jgi:DNA-binding response OmpR family regulator
VNDLRSDRLRVLALASDDHDAALLFETFAGVGDEVLSFVDMNAALAASEHAPPDLALVDVGMQQGSGLSLIHHLKSQPTRVDVYALVSPESLEAGAQAVSLGARAIIVRPLSGDELLTAARAVREARAVERERGLLVAEVETMRRDVAYSLRLSGLRVSGRAERLPLELLAMLGEVSGARVAALYEPRPGSVVGALRRKALWGELPEAPVFCDLEALRSLGRRVGYTLVPLTLGMTEIGQLVLGSPGAGGGRGPRLSPLLAAQTALVLSSVLTTSHELNPLEALPLALFVQAGASLLGSSAGDQRSKQAAQATLAALRPLGHSGDSNDSGSGPTSGDLPPWSEALLHAARGEGAVAGRGEDGTLFLLFPEASRLAQHARRRKLWEALGREGVREKVGLGVAGVVGRDERTLRGALRRSLRRAEASEHSPSRRTELASLSLFELLDVLSWAGPGAERRPASSLQPLDLPAADAAVVAARALEEAARLGEVSVTVSGRRGAELRPPSIFGLALATGRPLSLRSVGVAASARAEGPEALVLYGERGSYAYAGRRVGGMFHGVHTFDELLVDLIAARLGAAEAVPGVG